MRRVLDAVEGREGRTQPGSSSRMAARHLAWDVSDRRNFERLDFENQSLAHFLKIIEPYA